MGGALLWGSPHFFNPSSQKDSKTAGAWRRQSPRLCTVFVFRNKAPRGLLGVCSEHATQNVGHGFPLARSPSPAPISCFSGASPSLLFPPYFMPQNCKPLCKNNANFPFVAFPQLGRIPTQGRLWGTLRGAEKRNRG